MHINDSAYERRLSALMRSNTETPCFSRSLHLPLSPFVLDKLNFLPLSAGSETLSVSLSLCAYGKCSCIIALFIFGIPKTKAKSHLMKRLN